MTENTSITSEGKTDTPQDVLDGTELPSKRGLVDTEPVSGIEGAKGARVLIGDPPIYRAYHDLINLHGPSYEPIKKAVFYSQVANSIKPAVSRQRHRLGSPDEAKKNWIQVRGIGPIDSRINLGIPLPSGYGKKEFEKVIKRTEDQLDLQYMEPSSLHPEQLIGKTVIRDKSKPAVVNLGILSNDYVVIDEGIEFLQDRTQQTGRDYVCIALDPYGQNELVKKSVDALPGEEVRYYPICTVTIFFQPLPLGSHLVTRGLLRRMLIPFVQIDREERLLALEKTFTDDRSSEVEEENWQEWLAFHRGLLAEPHDWKFTDEAVALASVRTRDLINAGFDRGGNSRAYTDIMVFDLRNTLIKMSVVQAACNERDEVNTDDVDRAYRDLSEIWDLQLNFVATKIQGQIDYQEHIDTRLRACLSILEEHGCYSQNEGELSISEYDAAIAKRLGVTESSARNTYRRNLKDGGYIDSKQIGPHKTRVWLTERGRQLSP